MGVRSLRTRNLILTAISVFIIIAFVWYFISLLQSGALPEWLTSQLLLQIAAIILTIATPFSIAFYSSRPRLKTEDVRCVHSVRHSLVKKELTGTDIRVSLLLKNTGEKTSIYGCRIEIKSERYLYKKVDKETKIFVVKKNDTKPYEHRFFVSKYEILDLQLKCIFWLLHTNGEKKISVKSFRR